MNATPPGTAEPQLRIDAPNTEALARENAERGAVVQAELGLRGPREETGVRWYSRGYLPHYDDIQNSKPLHSASPIPCPRKRLPN